MMAWQPWFDMKNIPNESYSKHGIYRIRLSTPEGKAIGVPRIGGVDDDGILSIGRSGFRSAKTNRSLGTRLWEFLHKAHSSAYTYGLATKSLVLLPAFAGHCLWASIQEIPDDEIAVVEAKALRKYFDQYLELPPYNGAFPGR